MYFDTSYIAKFYLNEPDASQVRKLVRTADNLHSSLWAFAEFHAVLHRHQREGLLSLKQARDLAAHFSRNVEDGLWTLIPVSEALLRRTSLIILGAPRDLFLRTADAVHLATAAEIGERDIWTNDRQMLAAAPYFGLTGRTV